MLKRSESAGGVVIGPHGRILVVNQNGTSWSLPKGQLKPGEDKRTASAREIAEESGIAELEFIQELGSYGRYQISKDGRGENPNILKEITMFLYRTQQTELAPTDPANPEAKWVEPGQVAALLTHPKDKEFFQSVTKQVQEVIA